MPRNRDVDRRAQLPTYIRLAKEVNPKRERQMFIDYVCGKPIDSIAKFNRMTVSDTRYILRRHLRRLHKAERKWAEAEDRCRELAIENRQYKLRYDLADKRKLEHLNLPKRYRKWFEKAGVNTIGRLRSVHPEDLLKVPKFSRSAIAWAILELDRLNLSHCLNLTPEGKLARKRRAVQLSVMGLKGQR